MLYNIYENSEFNIENIIFLHFINEDHYNYLQINKKFMYNYNKITEKGVNIKIL